MLGTFSERQILCWRVLHKAIRASPQRDNYITCIFIPQSYQYEQRTWWHFLMIRNGWEHGQHQAAKHQHKPVQEKTYTQKKSWSEKKDKHRPFHWTMVGLFIDLYFFNYVVNCCMMKRSKKKINQLLQQGRRQTGKLIKYGMNNERVFFFFLGDEWIRQWNSKTNKAFPSGINSDNGCI